MEVASSGLATYGNEFSEILGLVTAGTEIMTGRSSQVARGLSTIAARIVKNKDALAEYGKTLFRFRVYTEHGYTEKAAELTEILDKDLENVGELDFAVSVFNDIVGLDY